MCRTLPTLSLEAKIIKRAGFTLIEVLVSVVVLVVGLLGVAGVMLNDLRKSQVPDDLVRASQLCAERLRYFRDQQNPFAAAGGTYYAKPMDPHAPSSIDFEAGGNAKLVNNNFNCVQGGNLQVMLCREYLLLQTPKQLGNAGGDQGLVNQSREANVAYNPATGLTTGVKQWAYNEVPETPSNWSGVVPNRWNIDGTIKAQGLVGPGGNQVLFGMAPMANPQLKLPIAAANTHEIAFAREVWVQTNNPFGMPYASANNFEPNTLSGAPYAPLWGAFAAMPNGPRAIDNLPPFTVSVTVRVYKVDVTRFCPGGVGMSYALPGYNELMPLAQQTGFFAPLQVL